jgi:hypothetical protein
MWGLCLVDVAFIERVIRIAFSLLSTTVVATGWFPSAFPNTEMEGLLFVSRGTRISIFTAIA